MLTIKQMDSSRISTRSSIGSVGSGIGGIKTLLDKKAKDSEGTILGVSAIGQRLIPDSEFGEIDFGCSVSKDDEVFAAIPFDIYNSGERSALKISVRFAFPLRLRGINRSLKIKRRGLGDKPTARREVWRDEHNENVDYSLPELGPHIAWRVQEPVDITYLSSIPMPEVHAVSKDGVPLTIKLADLKVIAIIDVQIWARDIKPVSGHFRVRRFEAENMKELQNKIEDDRENALKSALEMMEKDPENSEKMRAELLKNTIAVMPELTRVGKRQGGGSIYEAYHSERWKMAVLEISESNPRTVLRLSDGSIPNENVPDGSFAFRKAPDGSIQKLGRKKPQ